LRALRLDFSDIGQYPPAGHRGIWVLRPETQSIENTLSVLRGALALVRDEPTANRLWIVEPGRVSCNQDSIFAQTNVKDRCVRVTGEALFVDGLGVVAGVQK
jgi:hypothetical protein